MIADVRARRRRGRSEQGTTVRYTGYVDDEGGEEDGEDGEE